MVFNATFNNIALPQCSCIVIESSFDPGEQLQAPGSLWLLKSEQFS
jgi:hypothetical protein